MTVTVPYPALRTFVTGQFTAHGVPPRRAALAADALCHGDLTGAGSHGVFNLARLYLPLLRDGRADPAAEPRAVRDTGPCVLLDACRALGLWSAAEAMDLAVVRARRYGVGLVSVRGGTHLGCAGFAALRAASRGMVGVVASNCGGQRIARPPGGAVAMLGTNPLAVAAPAVEDHPFLLDMSTTVVPTGRVRLAAAAGEPVPAGWLADDSGREVTDPAAFDRGEAHLRWLGGTPELGVYKGFGLGLVVELLAAAVSGAGLGPGPAALRGDGRPSGRDDDIGFLLMAVAPLHTGFGETARSLFGALLACPPADPSAPVRYPGWPEAERARRRRREGVPLPGPVYDELAALGFGRVAVTG
ncbi:Ldh family oxidoreductase [Amycolatopsis thermalba]|uniref:Ldh family oxidoreductase n=1 Tax=Amycolatopsis thermalba TaxID=944492 RepID=A0ABY4NXM3_9PSEU|nr:Ldh family oxidoreductase [Amycolatopsis thermalba]